MPSNTLKGTTSEGQPGRRGLTHFPNTWPLPLLEPANGGAAPTPGVEGLDLSNQGQIPLVLLALVLAPAGWDPQDRVVRGRGGRWAVGLLPGPLAASMLPLALPSQAEVHAHPHSPSTRLQSSLRRRAPLGTRSQEGRPCEGSAEMPEAGAEASRVSRGVTKPTERAGGSPGVRRTR